MTNRLTDEDSRDLRDLFQAIRVVASLKPNTVALLSASVELMKQQLPKANLSPVAIAMAKHRGNDLTDVAVMTGVAEANAVADSALVARMPKERLIMLRSFAGTDVSAQAARARVLGWDRDRPDYPAAQPQRLP